MKVNCIHANDIDNKHCVQCMLGLFGGKPSISVCNSICTNRKPYNVEKADTKISLPKINIINIPKLPELPDMTGEEKFNTCQHRSDSEVRLVKRTCCKSFMVNGFKCEKLGIHPLTAKHCLTCNKYQRKI